MLCTPTDLPDDPATDRFSKYAIHLSALKRLRSSIRPAASAMNRPHIPGCICRMQGFPAPNLCNWE